MSEMRAPEIAFERRHAPDGSFTKVSSSDLFGRAHVLLAARDGYAWMDAAKTAREKFSGLALEAYRVGSKDLRDPEGRFAIEYGIGKSGAVLVRPDGSVAWQAESASGDPATELTAALTRVLGQRPRVVESAAAPSASAPKQEARAEPVAETPRTPEMREPEPEKSTPAAAAVAPEPARSSAGGFYNPVAEEVAASARMKLYIHPVSMASRPVRLFVAESGIKLNEEVVELPQGQHKQDDYTARNPSQLVPMLEDGSFRLTESSAILKFLADKIGSPAYPKAPRERAKVDEMMDWLNTQFFREWGYNLCYPQFLPHLKRRSDEGHAGTIEWGKQQSQRWLQVLNDHWIGENQYLVGNRITIADFLGVGFVTLGEVIGTDFSKYPNVARWLRNMKSLKHWEPVNKQFYGLVESNQGRSFETV